MGDTRRAAVKERPRASSERPMTDHRFKLVFRRLRGNLQEKCTVHREDGESLSDPSCWYWWLKICETAGFWEGRTPQDERT